MMNRLVSRIIITLLLSLTAATAQATVHDLPCTQAQLSTARTAMEDAEKALDLAINALSNSTPAQLDLLVMWFGIRSSVAAAHVKDKLVRTRAFTRGASFRCANSTDVALGDVYAFVTPDKSFRIVLGAFFFAAPKVGFSSQLGVLIHEMTHFTLAGATNDPDVYGPEAARRLAAQNPLAAQKNAENFEYFIEALVFGL